MAEQIRNGFRYNAATGRYLGPVTRVVAAHVQDASAPESVYEPKTRAELMELLDDAEVEYPSRASKPLLVEIAETEIG